MDDMKSKVGFNVGALVGYNFTDMLGLQSGLMLNTRGAQEDAEGYKVSINIYELQVPLFLTGTFAISDDFKIKANVGPTFGIGVSGKLKMEYGSESETMDLYKKEEGEDKSMAKRFDLGVAFGVGAEFKNIYLGVGYDLGVTNISNYDDDKMNTGSLMISLGFTF
jgi:hypothetical protein